MRLFSTLPLAAGAALLLGAAPSPANRPQLGFPLACRIGVDCEIQHYVDRDPGPGVLDYRCGRRTYQGHNGVDIRLLDMAQERRGVDVLAAASGRVTRLRDGVADVSIRTPGAASITGIECGNGVVVDHGGGWETQYCHMARGSLRVKAGDVVAAGQPLGHVGLAGQTEFPHLHVTVRHDGLVVDPFAPTPDAAGGCAPQTPLWAPAAMRQLAYKAGAILNLGFAPAVVSMEQVEAAAVAPVTPQAPALGGYVRAIGLEAGDEIELALSGPGGALLAQGRLKPLETAKDQYLANLSHRRPPAGWASGVYTLQVRVWRAGKVALQRQASLGL